MDKQRTSKLKKWLLAGAFALAGTIGIYRAYNQQTEANQGLRNFPEKISGAEAVRKYGVTGAQYALVHVRQEHSKEFNSSQATKTLMTQADLERVNGIQKRIYNILDELKQKGIIDSVYLEGHSKDLWERIEKLPYDLKMGLCEFDDSHTKDLEDKISELEITATKKLSMWDLPEGYTEETFRQEAREKKKKLSEELKTYRERYKYLEGAALRSVLEGKLKPRFAETPTSMVAYNRFLETGVLGNDAYNGREDIVLELVAEGKAPFALTVYGAAHDFKDNINRWNALHPEMKFSLIEVDPEGIDQKQKLNKPKE